MACHPIMVIASLEEGLRLANESRYGRSAYIFTNDYRTAMRAANRCRIRGELHQQRAAGLRPGRPELAFFVCPAVRLLTRQRLLGGRDG